MTASAVYRITCDAPACSAVELVKRITGVPAGWTKLDSRTHLDGWKPGRIPGHRGRTRQDKRTHWDVMSGGFVVHLCPEHPQAFREHVPRTEGWGGQGVHGDRTIAITCACGALRARRLDITLINDKRGPRHEPHRAWWEHLPEELQEYGTRSS